MKPLSRNSAASARLVAAASVLVASVFTLPLSGTTAHALREAESATDVPAVEPTSTRSPVPPHAVRLALVIGNGAYAPPLAKLPNAPADAKAIAAQLTSLGFQATLKIDLTRDQMKEAVESFAAAVKQHVDVIAFFFYAGHAVQVAGANVLLPVDKIFDDLNDVSDDGYVLGSVFDRLRPTGSYNVLVLDSCRNNPFPAEPGTVPMGLRKLRLPRNTFIGYAAEPDRVALEGTGTNSPYTEALLAHVPTPGALIEDVFERVRETVEQATAGQQVPWDDSTLNRSLYLAPPADTAAIREEHRISRSEEDELWLRICERDRADLYEDYLRRFPRGKYVAHAERTLKALADVEQQRDRAKAVGRAARERVLGHRPAADAPHDKLAALTRGLTLPELEAWEEVRHSDTATDFREYAERYPEGFFRKFADGMITALTELDAARATAASAMESQNEKHRRRRLPPPGVD